MQGKSQPCYCHMALVFIYHPNEMFTYKVNDINAHIMHNIINHRRKRKFSPKIVKKVLCWIK